jgi:hypothetical protein
MSLQQIRRINNRSSMCDFAMTVYIANASNAPTNNPAGASKPNEQK